MIDLSGVEYFGEVDDALISVADPASPSEGADSGAGEFFGGREGGDAGGGFLAADFAQAAVHIDGRWPCHIATGDRFDDIFKEGRGAEEPPDA